MNPDEKGAWEGMCNGRQGRDLRVEICDNCALALRDRDVFLACAFDDREGNSVLRHYRLVSIDGRRFNVADRQPHSYLLADEI